MLQASATPARRNKVAQPTRKAISPFPQGKAGVGEGSPHAAKTRRLPPTRWVSKHFAETPLIIPPTSNPRLTKSTAGFAKEKGSSNKTGGEAHVGWAGKPRADRKS